MIELKSSERSSYSAHTKWERGLDLPGVEKISKISQKYN